MTVKKLYVNKAVIVGIGVVIAIAIASGIYAVSTPQNDSPSGDIGMKDEVEATIEEPEEVPSVIKEDVEEKTGVVGEQSP